MYIECPSIPRDIINHQSSSSPPYYYYYYYYYLLPEKDFAMQADSNLLQNWSPGE